MVEETFFLLFQHTDAIPSLFLNSIHSNNRSWHLTVLQGNVGDTTESSRSWCQVQVCFFGGMPPIDAELSHTVWSARRRQLTIVRQSQQTRTMSKWSWLWSRQRQTRTLSRRPFFFFEVPCHTVSDPASSHLGMSFVRATENWWVPWHCQLGSSSIVTGEKAALFHVLHQVSLIEMSIKATGLGYPYLLYLSPCPYILLPLR